MDLSEVPEVPEVSPVLSGVFFIDRSYLKEMLEMVLVLGEL